jgi:hypothetical protein
MISARGMGWTRGLTGGALTLLLAGTAIAGPVVVRSTGPSARVYPAGRQLADNAQISLKAGDSLVLLDARGTRTVSGPGTFAATGSSTRVTTSQNAMRILATQGASERRGGAVRGGTPTGDTRSPNLWYVDLSKSGTVCVADPNAVRVWRGSSAKPAAVKITAATGSGAIALPQGASVAEWPKTVPVADGTDYTIAMDGMAPAKIRFATVPMPANLEDTASQLIAKGCKTQLDLLIATTSASGAAG